MPGSMESNPANDSPELLRFEKRLPPLLSVIAGMVDVIGFLSLEARPWLFCRLHCGCCGGLMVGRLGVVTRGYAGGSGGRIADRASRIFRGLTEK